MSLQSHLLVNVKFGGDVPVGVLVDCNGGVEIPLLVVEHPDGWCQQLWQL